MYTKITGATTAWPGNTTSKSPHCSNNFQANKISTKIQDQHSSAKKPKFTRSSEYLESRWQRQSIGLVRHNLKEAMKTGKHKSSYNNY
ncbi:hypothetical protein ODV97_18725 [Enterococcus gallinarum]|nr:hypothetical protein [Enterococcus gallinarum]